MKTTFCLTIQKFILLTLIILLLFIRLKEKKDYSVLAIYTFYVDTVVHKNKYL